MGLYMPNTDGFHSFHYLGFYIVHEIIFQHGFHEKRPFFDMDLMTIISTFGGFS